MRWPQFLLTLINLAFAIYILVLNVFFTETIDSLTFLWVLIYIFLALAIAHLYMLYMTNKLDDWYDVESLKSISNLSVISLLICLAALTAHFGLEYYNTRKIGSLNNKSLLKSSLTPLFAALVCSLVLFTSSIKFKKYVTLCQSIDLQPRHKKNYRTTD